MPRSSTEIIFSQSTEKIRRGTLLCSTKILVSKKTMDKSGGGMDGGREGGREGGRDFNVFLSKFCGLTVPKNFVEEPFCASQNFWYWKMLGIRGGASITFFRQFVLPHSAESSRRGMLLCFRKFRVSKKKFIWEGNRRIFYRKFVVSLNQRTS